MRFEWLGMDDVTPDFVSRWRALGLAATTPNVYLMPEFMLPAIRYLVSDKTHRRAEPFGMRTVLTCLCSGYSTPCLPRTWRFPFSRLERREARSTAF